MKRYEIIFVLLIIVFLISFVKGDTPNCDDCETKSATSCSGSSCDPNCRPKFSYSNFICKYCNFEGKNFYSISDGTCGPKDNCEENEKIIYGSNECVSYCDTNSYKMGDYCYYENPSNDNIQCDSSNKNCHCKYKYYITKSSINQEEYHCLSENDECPSGYDYYNYDSKQCSQDDSICNSKKTRIILNDDSEKYRCSSNCFSNEKIVETNYCVEDCAILGKKYYYPDREDKKKLKCVDSCSNLKEQDNECVSTCDENYYLNNLNENQCISLCPSGFYQVLNTGEKKCVDVSSASNCLYSKDKASDNNKKCYTSCIELISEGYNSYINQKNNMCTDADCVSFYAIIDSDNNIKKCYESKSACKNDNYKYYKDNQCLLECNDFKEGRIEDDGTLKLCFDNIAACISKGYKYYTQPDNKCYSSSCPNDLYPQQDTTITGGFLCTSCDDLKISKGYCKSSCDDDECYFIDNTNNAHFNPNECKSISTYFYHTVNSGGSNIKICVDNCKSQGKFYFEGKKECVDVCKKTVDGADIFLYYEPTDNKCVEQCDNGNYIFAKEPTTTHEKCDIQCPSGIKHLLEDSHKCIDSCPPTHPYRFKDSNFDTNNHYICKSSISYTCTGNNYLYLDDQCTNAQNCVANGKNKINSKNICGTACEDGYNYIEKVIDELYKCKEHCDGSKYIFINNNDEKECVDECPQGKNKVGENKECKAACESTDGTKFYELSKKDTYSIYKCVSTCPKGYLLHTNDNTDNQCYKECPDSHKYLLSSTNTCYDKCINSGISFPYSLSYTENGITKNICAFSCNDATPNYESYDKICKKGCKIAPNTITNYNGECVAKCDDNEDIYKYNLDGRCYTKCAGNVKRFYYNTVKNEYICIAKCEGDNNYVLNSKCVPSSSCPNTKYSFNTVIIDGLATGEIECLYKCPHKFYKKDSSGNKICLEQCDQGDYALIQDTYECVSSCTSPYHSYEPGTVYPIKSCVKTCPEDKPYLNENECVDTCNPKYLEDNECKDSCSSGKYYVGQFLPDDPDQENKCLSDCPQGYPYYIRKSDGTFICTHECPSNLKFHQNENIEKVGMECISTCPNDDYKYLSDDEKECLKFCPQGKYYVVEPGQKCLDECPEENPYHIKNKFECKKIEECLNPDNFIDYENKICIKSCEGFKYKYEKKESDGTIKYTVCLNDCSLFSKYLTPDNKCVDSCDEDDNLEIDTNEEYKCKCKYYFYKDISTSEINCLDSTTSCENTEQYKIRKINTNECLNTCPNILSLDGDLCLTEENQCGINTQVIAHNSGQAQCSCLNKFYTNTDTNKKICLSLGEKCPGNYEYYIPSTKQCINTCSNKKFKNFCLNVCPKGSTQSESECICSKYWYSISDTNFECLNACLPSHPFSIHDTSQCIPKCRNTEYPFLVNGECYSNCETFPNTIPTNIQSFEKDYEFAEKTCRCVNLWYLNTKTNSIVCPEDSNKKELCQDFTDTDEKLNFLVGSTKQCVTSCPSDYPFSFNDECFRSCEEAKLKFLYDIEQDGDSTICICNNLWKYETINDIRKKIYLLEPNCPEHSLEIIDTRECQIFAEDKPLICPESSPLEFNNKCYKIDKCPINSHYDSNKAGKCVCDNLLYIDEDSNKINCLSNDTDVCTNDYSYLIYETKQCFKPDESKDNKCPNEYPYEFNKICYKEKCPELTKAKSNKICICDETKGKWYKYSPDDINIYLYCGIDECPTENPNKPNLIENKNQCTFNCDEDSEENYIWSYKNLCYKECPEFTKINTYEKKCEFYQIKEAKDLQELNNFVSVQVKELYDSGPKGGYLFHNEESSLQIYPYNKLGDSPAKEIIKKSNLTFIDLNTCLSKIFEDQDLDEDDQIFVVKYDLLNNKKEKEIQQGDETEENVEDQIDNKNNEHYLINEVEYEFYSSKTLQRIDASVCEPKEIIISYPITYTLSKFDKLNDTSNLNHNEYRQKFNLGKDLNQMDNTIDTFNSNNSIYKELCMPLEINGKDLVLEQRYDVLFPNNISLCEKNCTLFYTDYILERIYCKCDYKEVLDFNREMPVIGDLFSDPNFAKTTQSGANGEIIKCLSNLPNKDSIIKNEAFYYSTVILVGEISMIFIAGFYSIKLVKGKIYNLGRKNNGNNKGNKEDNKKEIIIATSNRLFNSNPPKKNNISINEDINNNNNEEENPKEKKPYSIKKRTIFNLNRNANEENKDNDIIIKDIFTNINNENKFIEIKDIKGKAEFIPPEYNFKFFKKDDTGITKKIKRNEIPFPVKSSTKYLLEYKKNINYDEDYLNGPIYLNQNMLEIIEDETQIENNKENDVNKKIVYKGNNNNNIIETKREKIRTRSIKNEKSFITIKTINPLMKVSEVEYTEEYDYNVKQKIDESVSLYYLIKREQTMLRIPYKIYVEKNHKNLLAIILAEIMDKIYIIKICCFLKPFEMFSVHLFNYLLYHIMLLTLLCNFFTIKTIKKIYNESDFPKINFYLLYGLISSIIIWVIYKLFLCLLDHRDKVNDLIRIRQGINKGENNNEEINEELYDKKYNELIKRIKIHMSIFFIIGILITAFCFIYLVSFFAIYTGTKSKVFKAYYITLIEIAIIKFIYGLCLASLRKAGEVNEIENVYKVPYICNKYIC